MKPLNNVYTSLIGGIATAALLCTGPQTVTNGGGTGVGNAAVSGKVIYSDSTPVVGAMVRVRPASYVQDTSRETARLESGRIINCVTDSAGIFRIDSLDTGMFCIEVIDNIDSAHGTFYRFDSRDTGQTVLEPRVVTPVTKISGSIVVSGLPQNAWVQLYGIEALGKTDSLGRFEIAELPLGDCEENECEYTLRILTTINSIPVANDYKMEVEWNLGGTTTVEIELGDD